MSKSGIANGLEYSLGNNKVPFVIVNFGSATHCPSKALGLCQCPIACYAKIQEEMYPRCLPFRTRQETWWKNATEESAILAADEMELQRENRKTQATEKVLRFSESGDSHNQHNVEIFAAFANRLIFKHGWTVYGYTARTDLNLSSLIKIGVKINRSNNHNYRRYNKNTNRFLAVKKASGNNFLCIGDCAVCNICRIVTGKTIEIELHGKRRYKQKL